MITIQVNSKDFQLNANLTLVELIEHLKISSKGIAIAINQSIIAQDSWEKTHLQNNDDLLIVQSTQGG
jgi:sulfur carrier protein